MRAVLDTSVLLSVERRPLLFLAAQQRYTLVWSAYIADEVARKLVDYLVTWNTRYLPPKRRFAGITILAPDAFLRRLGHPT